MGRVYTPKYAVHFRGNVTFTPACWRARGSRAYPGAGRPTDTNLEKYVREMNESFKPGGVNEHVSTRFIAYVSHAEIIDQDTREVVATYDAPAFEVV